MGTGETLPTTMLSFNGYGQLDPEAKQLVCRHNGSWRVVPG